MWGRGSKFVGTGALIVSLLGLSLLTMSASASLGYPDMYPGAVGGEGMKITTESDFQLVVLGNGTNHFNVYIAPIDGYNNFSRNGSFSYILEYSRLNVTNAYINGTLPVGDYQIVVKSLEQGDVTIHDPVISPRADVNRAVTLSWDTIATITVTAAISSTVTFFVARKRYRP